MEVELADQAAACRREARAHAIAPNRGAAISNFMGRRRSDAGWTDAAPSPPGGPSCVIQGEDDVVRPPGLKHAPPDCER
jgi:hypothetical protein